ncbi:SpoVG family protein, partial [Clostridioides difficile]|nr:SpoVG family protein [Clostridioides difficile]
IAMPSRKVGEGNFRDIAHPINAEMRQVLEDAVLQAYHEALVQWEVAAE